MNTDIPFFSIILPTYNRAKFLPRAIDSVLTQKFKNFELIIIDDASTDNTKQVVETYVDDRIIYSRNEKNIERSASRNIGINKAQGNYICFLDSDDYYLENHLEVFYSKITRNNATKSMLYTRLFRKTQDGLQEYQIPPIGEEHPIEYMLQHALITGICLPAEVLELNKFDEELIFCEDLDLWSRVLLKVNLVLLPDFTGVYELGEQSSTHSSNTNVPTEQLRSLRKIFSNSEVSKFVAGNIKKGMIGDRYFLLAINYEKQGAFFKTVQYLILSFFYTPGSNQNLMKLYMIWKLFKLKLAGGSHNE